MSSAILTFVAHRRLPYRRMLVFTGVMLGLVLLVMVGEQVQEMQLARWLPTTPVAHLQRIIPDWMGLWFAVFPTVETSPRRSSPARSSSAPTSSPVRQRGQTLTPA